MSQHNNLDLEVMVDARPALIPKCYSVTQTFPAIFLASYIKLSAYEMKYSG